MGHLMTAACLHHEVTGKLDMLSVAIKSADFPRSRVFQTDRELARHAICPAHYLGILDLYRVTGKGQYLRLAERFLAMRDLVEVATTTRTACHSSTNARSRRTCGTSQLSLRWCADLFSRKQLKSLLETLTKLLGQRPGEEALHHRWLRSIILRCIARRLQGTEADHAYTSSLWTQLPIAQRHSSQ